ncbi:hypothetical protein EYF80_056445 [Liparis tanakae]|uniref:Uncharacterized protein n=1 Tax=Liparis tanakae TaxID=230148 RepID=A0A4Z2EXU3_9TELE|nr:hypothetical protein EYF80_056445 [Liparis tanakae]
MSRTDTTKMSIEAPPPSTWDDIIISLMEYKAHRLKTTVFPRLARGSGALLPAPRPSPRSDSFSAALFSP